MNLKKLKLGQSTVLAATNTLTAGDIVIYKGNKFVVIGLFKELPENNIVATLVNLQGFNDLPGNKKSGFASRESYVPINKLSRIGKTKDTDKVKRYIKEFVDKDLQKYIFLKSVTLDESKPDSIYENIIKVLKDNNFKSPIADQKSGVIRFTGKDKFQNQIIVKKNSFEFTFFKKYTFSNDKKGLKEFDTFLKDMIHDEKLSININKELEKLSKTYEKEGMPSMQAYKKAKKEIRDKYSKKFKNSNNIELIM